MQIDALNDALISFVASGGVLAYLGYCLRRRRHTQMERRLLFLLGCLGLLLLLRGFAWLYPASSLSRWSFLPALLIPLGTTLFAEALLRRHAPLLLKYVVAVGSAGFLILHFTTTALDAGFGLGAFVVFEIAILACLAMLLQWRDRRELSVSENRMVDALLITCLLSVPLAVTDFRGLLGFPPVRMGSIAALLLVYVLVRHSHGAQEKRAIARELGGVLAKALVLAGGFWAMAWPQEPAAALAYGVLAVSFVLALTIFERLAELARNADQYSFQHWLRNVRLESLDAFLESLRGLPVMQDALVVLPSQMTGYDLAQIHRLLAHEDGPLTLERAREIADTASAPRRRLAAEQLVDLLYRHQANTACMLRASPLTLLLVTMPQIAGSHRRESELAVIQKLARGLEQGAHHDLAA